MKRTPNNVRLENITDNYINVIILISRGMTLEQIAEKLERNVRTVKDWQDRLRFMLDVETSREIPYRYFKRTGNNPLSMKLRYGEDE